MKKALLMVWLLVATIVFTGNTSGADGTSKYIDSITGDGVYVNGAIADLIDGADNVRVALFYGYRKASSDTALWTALKEAAANTTVEIVTEGKMLDPARNPWGTAATASQRYFHGLESAGADVTYCDEGCIVDRRGDGYATSINHHKFFLIEKGRQKVLVQSSANEARTNTRWEQAIVLDGVFYDNVWNQYVDRFDEMQRSWKHGASSVSASLPGRPRQAMAYLGPHSDADGDEFLKALKRVRPGPDCSVRIVMGHWTDTARSKPIVNRLNQLVAKGCSVDAIHGGKADISVQRTTAAIDFELEHQSNVHAKFMTLKYKQSNGEVRRLVYAGSHNLTKGSLEYDDDAFLRIDRPEIYADFCTFFGRIEGSMATGPHRGKLAPGSC